MPSLFRTWTYKHAVDAHARLVAATVGDQGYKANLAFAEKGDHWQGGDAWPVATGLNPAIRAKLLNKVEPQFRPVDVISEALDNVANGLLDKEADVTFAPLVPAKPETTEAQQQEQEIAATVARISKWWDRQQFWEQARKATRRSRWSTRGATRLWITPAVMVSTRDAQGKESKALPTNLSADDALDAVQVMAPSPDVGFVYTDPDSQEQVGVFFYSTGDATQSAAAVRKHAELWFVDGEDTVLRVVHESNEAPQEFPVKMGKRVPIAQMEADLLITETVRRQQKGLNYFETLLMRVVETAGFPERYTINAKPSGVWLREAPANEPPIEVQEIDGVKWYLHAAPRELGPAVTTDLRGITGSSGTTGGEVIMTPSVTWKDPTDPEYLIKACAHGRKTMLRECKQGHLATDSVAESSGLAYIQARAIFGKDLNATKAPLEGMVRRTIEAAIALADALSGTAPAQSFLAKYRCVVNLHVDTGPALPTELAENREQNKAGLLSRRSAMARGGVEDTDAELSALDEDPVALASLWTVRGQAMAAMQLGGASFLGAALALGLSADEANNLMATDLAGIKETP